MGRWLQVLTSQIPCAAAACMVLVPAVVAAVVARFVHPQPTHRPFLAYDARISAAMRPDTVHPILTLLVPFVALLLTLAICELWASPTAKPKRASLAAALHYALDSVLAAIITICVTEVTKNAVGKLRPDFMDRCQPLGVYNTTAIIQWAVTEPPSDCTSTASAHTLIDGRKSFPSGHSSSAACGSVYAAAYVLCTAFVRPHGSQQPRSSLAQQLGLAAALLWALVLLLFALYVGVTRIVDNRHHGEDVIAGWLIGAVVAMAVFLHAVATVEDVVAACGGAGRASGGALQLSESGEGSDAGDTPLCSHA